MVEYFLLLHVSRLLFCLNRQICKICACHLYRGKYTYAPCRRHNLFALLDTIQLDTKHFVVLQYLINFPNMIISYIIFRISINAYYQETKES